MRLEDKFFNSFFYLFLISITLSLVIIITILFYFSGNILDERTASEVYYLEKRNAKANINSMNILLSNIILKLQVVLQEQVTHYQDISNTLVNVTTDLNLSNIDVYNPYLLKIYMKSQKPEFMERLLYTSLWFINPKMKNIKQLSAKIKKQIYAFSLMTQSFLSIMNPNNDILKNVYFIFDDTDLFLAYPFTYYYTWKFLDTYNNFTNNPSWCTDAQGNTITYYKFKCRNFYEDIMSAQKGRFDHNKEDQKDRTVFIVPPYPQSGISTFASVITICIKFKDPLSNSAAYACGDSEDQTIFSSFDLINDYMRGNVVVSSVGFSQAFYFPHIMAGQYKKTLGEFIFTIDNNYYLEEKMYFVNTLQKYLTSNYIKLLNEKEIEKEPMNIFDEIIIDGYNGKYQTFYLNKEKLNFCVYPIFIENMEKKYEHILTIIYLYSENNYYNHMAEYQRSSNSRLTFILIIYFFFAFIILYLISLSFKSLAKLIVIPIKNVHYMLEGINIGGEYRLEYLSDLRKNQEDNLDKLKKINNRLKQKNKKSKLKDLFIKDKEKIQEKEIVKDKDKLKSEQKKITTRSINTSIKKENRGENEKLDDSFFKGKEPKNYGSKLNNKNIPEDDKLNDSNNNLISNEETDDDNINFDEEYIDTTIDYEKKYDSDGIMIEKELNFYDFDEELLQYRPAEVNNLVQSLLHLKGALILTSKSQEVENIIGYTNSEHTFINFKNKTGSRMCNSNIGNLQSRLYKYDKAIYHLALSLQNVDLKKFLSSSLSDEFDENDTLLHKIELNYRKDKKEKDVNKLVKKQQKGKNANFPQKTIGILINSRYNKLIHIYFKFFAFIQKNNTNYEKLSGYFMHTKFHSINYYHKILIQYIYLCFLSNDLVKIGESILDYIEFLIKFKLKTSEENSYIMNINNIENPEIREKQLIKRKYFDKIMNWFYLFDNYAKQINENSTLGNYKNVIDSYVHNLQSNHSQIDSGNESASALLFQINLQRYDYLRGKFALACEDYNDALGFMISAAKQKRIVIDGLIKKRALKHIYKIAQKLRKKIINSNFSKMNFNKIIEKDNFKDKQIQDDNPINNLLINNNKEKEVVGKSVKLIDKMKSIIENINNDINETNENQLKDIIVLIDCNYCNKLEVDSYIDVTKTILKNYLTNNDRLGVFFLVNEYKIICPMMKKEEIDIISFYKDLDVSSEKVFKKEKIEYSSMVNEEIQGKINSESFESIPESKHNSFNDSSSDFNDNGDYINKGKIKMDDKIKSINYCISYLKMKEINVNEKYFIYFCTNIKEFMTFMTEMRNQHYLNNLSYESNQKNKIYLKREKNINFLLVGKFRQESEEDYKSYLLEFFDSKSDLIPFDNMKKIKSILSSNNNINYNIIFPNEVYK